MTDNPRLGPVSFRGVSTKLPAKPAPPPPASPDPALPTEAPVSRAVLHPPGPASQDSAADDSKPSRPPTSPPTRAGERTGPARTPTRPARRGVTNDGPEPPDRVGSAQIAVRLPVDLAQWVTTSPYTHRSLVLMALAEYGEQIPPNDDPIVVSRRRLGLPVRPTQRRRGPNTMINIGLRREEKQLIEARAAELDLTLTDLIVELLRRTQADDAGLS